LIQKTKTMKAKYLSLATAALLTVGGLWLARSAWRTHAVHKSNTSVGFKTQSDQPTPGQMLRPPNPTRRFTDFTPEQRVEFARKGHGPGG
jgi:ABC-type nickel/cobalt efflux system permease component RcnA